MVIGSEKYLKEVIRNMEENMNIEGIFFTSKTIQPVSSLVYQPELDGTKLFVYYQTKYYQNLVGIVRWSVEIGSINIQFEITYLSRYLIQPRMDHL